MKSLDNIIDKPKAKKHKTKVEKELLKIIQTFHAILNLLHCELKNYDNKIDKFISIILIKLITWLKNICFALPLVV